MGIVPLARNPQKDFLSNLQFHSPGEMNIWHVIPTGAPFSLFLLLEIHKKFVKIGFSSVAEKKGICTRKVFILEEFKIVIFQT